MAVPVIMPRQGQSVEACVITEWIKKKGDKVKEGDILFSYETDKASFDEEAKADGILLEIFYYEGDEVPVLTNVAVIGEKGEAVDEFRPGTNLDTADSASSKPDKGGTSHTDEKKSAPSMPEIKSNSAKTIKISPRAKRKANALNIDYTSAEGSGPNGRIMEKDIDLLAKSKTGTSSETGTAAQKTVSQDAHYGKKEETIASYDDAKLVKLSNIRKIIAKNMHASLQNSAQLTHHISADARKMLDLRKKIKLGLEQGSQHNITLNDMVCFAVIKALKNHPTMNAHFLEDSMQLFNKVHLGIAVDTERGLMVPTIRNADDFNLEGLSTNIKKVADSCKSGNIDPELLASTSASFTVSNLGAYGIEMFTPVINLPQTGILGVNTISYKPADIGDGHIGFIPHIGLSLTYDHRAIDGTPASAFLKEVKEQIENVSL